MAKITRRTFLETTAKIGGLALTANVAPTFLRHAWSQEKHAAYLNAQINWRQVEGEEIKILVTPAHYFNKFRAVSPQFEDLTGIKVTFDIIPPREMREKAVLDFGAGTATYATHTGDPMFLSLYETNKWIEPLDDYINDPKLTDKKWFDKDDIIPLWLAANSVKGKLYALPSEGEATIHVFIRELYEKKGL